MQSTPLATQLSNTGNSTRCEYSTSPGIGVYSIKELDTEKANTREFTSRLMRAAPF